MLLQLRKIKKQQQQNRSFSSFHGGFIELKSYQVSEIKFCHSITAFENFTFFWYTESERI